MGEAGRAAGDAHERDRRGAGRGVRGDGRGRGAFADRAAASAAKDTAEDPLLALLEPLLADAVGAPFDDEQRAAATAEAQRRIEAQEPPGHRDGGKDPSHAVGDYLIWAQLLDEAERRDGDVLFVTADEKDDWWRLVDRDRRGPQVKLVAELRARDGGRLFMLTPAEFLETAKSALGVAVHEESVEQARAVGRAQAAAAVTAADIEEYWFEYLGRSARQLFRAAAEVEQRDGPGYTFDNIAAQLGVDPQAVRAVHRNSGRSAERWRQERNTRSPVELEWSDYSPVGPDGAMRTSYNLPPGVAEEILSI